METVKLKSNENAEDKKKIYISERINLFSRHKTVEKRNCTVEGNSREILIKPQGEKKIFNTESSTKGL